MSQSAELAKCGCGGTAMFNPVETTKPGKSVTYDLNLGYVGCTNCGIRTEGRVIPEVAAADWNRAFGGKADA